MGTRAAIYVRISRDRTGESLGVQRQESECRELCDRYGWTVVDVLTDNDVSAYSGKRRLGYEQLLTMIRAGEVDVVVAWNTDRLHRRLIELVEYTDVCAPRSVTTHTVRTGPIDLSTPSGILVAQQLGAVAEYESRNRSARVRAAKEQRAASGSWSGGTRPFGWGSDGITEVPAEVRRIKAANRYVLGGGSLSAVARKWRADGVQTVTGRQWTSASVREVLLRARNAGLRVHRGVVVGLASWTPIIDPEDWHAVRRLLTDPDRRVSPGGTPRYLGSKRFLCGATLPDGSTCGTPMIVKKGGKPPTRKYQCARMDKERSGTTHVVVNQDKLDAYVVSELLAGMVEQGFGPRPSADDSPVNEPAVDDVSEIEAAQAALASELAAGRMSAVAFTASNKQLAERLEALQDHDSVSVLRRATDERFDGFERDPVGVWNALPLELQRDTMDDFVTVTVLPAQNRSRWTEPVSERVRFEWNFQSQGGN